MKTASFTNFSTEPFTGYWDGKAKTFKPGQTVFMPEYLAKHYAKHLANRELLKIGKDRDTSPKVKIRQDGTEYVDNQSFLEMFNKAFKEETEQEEFSAPNDPVDVQIDVTNKNREAKDELSSVQIADLPVEGDEEEFENSVNNNQTP